MPPGSSPGVTAPPGASRRCGASPRHRGVQGGEGVAEAQDGRGRGPPRGAGGHGQALVRPAALEEHGGVAPVQRREPHPVLLRVEDAEGDADGRREAVDYLGRQAVRHV